MRPYWQDGMLTLYHGRATMEKWNRVSERIGCDIRLGPDDWLTCSKKG